MLNDLAHLAVAETHLAEAQRQLTLAGLHVEMAGWNLPLAGAQQVLTNLHDAIRAEIDPDARWPAPETGSPPETDGGGL